MQITSDAKIELLKDSEERPLLVLESRQKTAIAFGAVMVIGIIACASYLVGRRVNTVSANGPAPVVARAPRKAKPAHKPAAATPVVVAQAAAAPAVVAAAPAAPPTPVPAAIPAPAAAPTSGASGLIVPTKGQNYLQVGFLTPDTVQPFLDQLAAKGFHGKVTAGDDHRTVRVLVGPLKNADVMAVSGELTKAGFANFPKYY